MPEFSYFSENAEFLFTQKEALNETNIERYLAQHNIERFLGYKEALFDIIRELDEVLHFYKGDDGPFLNSPVVVKRELLKWLELKETFLQLPITNGSKDVTKTANDTPKNV